MRLKVEIDDLTPEQWDQAERLLKDSYDIPEDASRVCLTLIHGPELRHHEVPVSAFTTLMWGMSLAPAFKELARAVKLAGARIQSGPAVPKVKNTGVATATGPGSFANTGYVGKEYDPDFGDRLANGAYNRGPDA